MHHFDFSKQNKNKQKKEKSFASLLGVVRHSKISKSGVQPGIFRCRGGFLDWGRFDKGFMYDIQKKGPKEKDFVVVSLKYS